MSPRDDFQPPPFVPPTSLAEAEARRLALVASVADIDAQLADRDRHDPCTGSRLTAHAYWTWRQRAIAAHRFKATELRALNAWIRQHHRQHHRQSHGHPLQECLRALVAAVQVGDRQQLQAAVRQARGVLEQE